MTTRAAIPGSVNLRRGAVWAALALLLLAGAVLVLYVGRKTSFYFDEWDFVQGRRAWNADTLLSPHNEHLSLLPVLLYKLIFAVGGIASYVPFRVAMTLVHLLVCALLFVYARRRVGDVLALAAVAPLLFLGTAWPDLLWPFQTGFLGSLAAGLAALLALDRDDRRGDIAAAALLTASIASSSIGLPVFAAAALEILGRPDRRRRWFVLVIPAALYVLWYLGYGAGEDLSVDNLLATPGYVANAAAGAVGALFGLGFSWGRSLTVALIAALVLSLRRGAADPWRLAGLVALPLIFWTLTALARAELHEPAAPRYLYPGVLFLLLIALEAARGIAVPRPAVAALLVLVAFTTLANVGQLRDGGGYLRDHTVELDGALAAVTLPAPGSLPPEFEPSPDVAPQIKAKAYLDAVKDLGSPAPTAAQLPQLIGRARSAADETLTRAYGIGLKTAGPRTGAHAPATERAVGAGVKPGGGCLTARPQLPGGLIELTVPPQGLLLSSAGGTATVAVRRFSDTFPSTTVGQILAGAAPVLLRIPSDISTAPLHTRVELSGAVRVCAPPAS
jgi:hypothetical protein